MNRGAGLCREAQRRILTLLPVCSGAGTPLGRSTHHSWYHCCVMTMDGQELVLLEQHSHWETGARGIKSPNFAFSLHLVSFPGLPRTESREPGSDFEASGTGNTPRAQSRVETVGQNRAREIIQTAVWVTARLALGFPSQSSGAALSNLRAISMHGYLRLNYSWPLHNTGLNYVGPRVHGFYSDKYGIIL